MDADLVDVVAHGLRVAEEGPGPEHRRLHALHHHGHQILHIGQRLAAGEHLGIGNQKLLEGVLERIHQPVEMAEQAQHIAAELGNQHLAVEGVHHPATQLVAALLELDQLLQLLLGFGGQAPLQQQHHPPLELDAPLGHLVEELIDPQLQGTGVGEQGLGVVHQR